MAKTRKLNDPLDFLAIRSDKAAYFAVRYVNSSENPGVLRKTLLKGFCIMSVPFHRMYFRFVNEVNIIILLNCDASYINMFPGY